MEHPLALAVLNDSSHYGARVRNARSMSDKNYAAYIRGLVIEEARVQRIKFRVKSQQSDIEQSVTDVVDTMRTQLSEWNALSEDPEVTPPPGFLPDRIAGCNHG